MKKKAKYLSEVFVFGSNLAGRHGAGAALDAKTQYGAKTGVGEGPTGKAYAIPTKDAKLKPRSLKQIKKSVDKFLDYAQTKPKTLFRVTSIGCGLAGYKPSQIAPMFVGRPTNVSFFDSRWEYAVWILNFCKSKDDKLYQTIVEYLDAKPSRQVQTSNVRAGNRR